MPLELVCYYGIRCTLRIWDIHGGFLQHKLLLNYAVVINTYLIWYPIYWFDVSTNVICLQRVFNPCYRPNFTESYYSTWKQWSFTICKAIDSIFLLNKGFLDLVLWGIVIVNAQGGGVIKACLGIGLSDIWLLFIHIMWINCTLWTKKDFCCCKPNGKLTKWALYPRKNYKLSEFIIEKLQRQSLLYFKIIPSLHTLQTLKEMDQDSGKVAAGAFLFLLIVGSLSLTLILLS